MLNKNHCCVVRKGSVWLGIPAAVTREVLPRPSIVPVPRSHRVLTGLGHIRSEFVPILNTSCLLGDYDANVGNFIVLIEDRDGIWGLLVDEVNSLALLEPSHAPEAGAESWESAIVGWATYSEQVVRVLDPVRFGELAQRELNPEFQRQRRENAGDDTDLSNEPELATATA